MEVLVESSKHTRQTFGSIATSVAQAAYKQGLVDKVEVATVDAEAGDKLIPHASILLATNARTRATKARDLLGWRPSSESLQDYIGTAVKDEASRLGRGKL